MKNNITLIGMPGSGKSTVGVVLAKRLGRRFVDSDLVIQERHGKLLHELITEHGVEGFWQIESNVNASLNLENSIIATGGSACYEPEGMQHLRLFESGKQHHCHRRKCLLRAGGHAASAGYQHRGIFEASL